MLILLLDHSNTTMAMHIICKNIIARLVSISGSISEHKRVLYLNKDVTSKDILSQVKQGPYAETS